MICPCSVDVAVIVLNWNSQADTIACLLSLNAAYSESSLTWRSIVVDNGSTNQDEFVSTVEKDFDICTVVNPTNIGFAGGVNCGIKHATLAGARSILLVNNDATVEPSFATEIEKGFHAGYAVLSPLILSPGSQIFARTQAEESISGNARQVSRIWDDLLGISTRGGD
jgi:glycosyltransferase involved in cell wall biosynthesis